MQVNYAQGQSSMRRVARVYMYVWYGSGCAVLLTSQGIRNASTSGRQVDPGQHPRNRVGVVA